MKLSQLEQIIEVATTGTISQAAINLYVTQPSLSLSIKKAEDELGTKLFERNSTGMILTPLGNEFVDRAKEILEQVDALSDAFRSNKMVIPLELSLASIGHRVIDIEVANLLKKYGQNFMKINMIDHAGIKLLDCVAENRAELGFCTVYDFNKKVMMRQMAMRKLEYHVIANITPGIYIGANNKHFGPNDKVVDFNKIEKSTIVHIYNREFNSRSIMDHLQEKVGVSFDPQNQITVSNIGMVRNMINLTDSYSIVSYIDIDYGDKKFYPDMRFIPFPEGLVKSEFCYFHKENTVRSMLANELIKNIRSRLEMAQ